jgi:N-methylhydantoinase A
VCLMNAYVNGEHEQAIREILLREMPNIPVSLSSEVLPEMYEYERALTTVSVSNTVVTGIEGVVFLLLTPCSLYV